MYLTMSDIGMTLTLVSWPNEDGDLRRALKINWPPGGLSLVTTSRDFAVSSSASSFVNSV